jgi:dTDP-N-acetylfucosamine:lipid II N-acetylfucosaminyltransferase
MRTRVTHLVLDQKFIDNAITVFDSLPDVENEFLLVSRNGQVSSIAQRSRVTVLPSEWARLRFLRSKRPDVVILHSLFFGAALGALAAGRAPVVWISWGNDLYKDRSAPFASTYPFRHSLFMPETRRWKESRKGSLRGNVKGWAVALLRHLVRSRAIRKIRFASTCLPYEFPALQKRYPHLRPFSFDYIDHTAVSLPRCHGLDVLIGNSASINCNHLDIIRALKSIDLPARRIIVPLSYAGGESYRDTVIKAGTDAFGAKFMPLTRFIGIDEYVDLVQQCGFAIMGFLRQQATKNIQILLYQGAKVFFYRETDIFRHFSDAGYAVYSIEDDLNQAALSSPMSDDDFARNRALIEKQFDYGTNLRDVSRSLDDVVRGGR